MEINKNEINNDLPKKGPTYLEILFILYYVFINNFALYIIFNF